MNVAVCNIFLFQVPGKHFEDDGIDETGSKFFQSVFPSYCTSSEFRRSSDSMRPNGHAEGRQPSHGNTSKMSLDSGGRTMGYGTITPAETNSQSAKVCLNCI